MQNNAFYSKKTLNVRGRLVDLTEPRIMGILNVTPDSFFDGGKFRDETAILAQVKKMYDEGATFIDVGGASSRPGAAEISEAEELSRVIPVVKAIVKNFPDLIVSIDTVRASVAKKAIEDGAGMVNDISAGERDPGILGIVAEAQVPYIMMHMRGTPQTMTQLTNYENLVKDIADYFHKKISTLYTLGIKDIVIDPGFGFAKSVQQNFELLQKLDYFRALGLPLLAGLSRKSMVWRTLEITPEDALNGTTVLNTVALIKGASILRVHDVREARHCIKLISKLQP